MSFQLASSDEGVAIKAVSPRSTVVGFPAPIVAYFQHYDKGDWTRRSIREIEWSHGNTNVTIIVTCGIDVDQSV